MSTRDVRLGKGFGFVSKGKLYLKRCFECGRENYAPAVATGCCAFCGANGQERLEKELCNFCNEPCNTDHCVTKRDKGNA